MDVPGLEVKEATMRIRSAPANPRVGSRLLSSRQSKILPRRVILSRASQSRSHSRGNYRRSYTSASKPHTKPTLVSTSIVRAPGYTLTRTPSSVKMDINTSAFFVGGEEEEENKESSRFSKPTSKRDSPTASTLLRAAMLDVAVKEKEELEIEVAKLNIQIASIKEEFEEQANQREEEFLQLRREISKEHQDQIDELEEKHHQAQEHHNKVVKIMNEEFEEERNQCEEKLAQAEERLQQSFVDRETALQKLKKQLEESHRDEIEQLRKVQEEEIERRLEEVRADMELQHRQEMEEISAEHTKEIEGMVQKYNEAMSLKDDLQKSVKKNKKLEKELSRQKEKVRDAKKEQTEAEILLQNTTENLKELQDNLQEKVWKVESKYRDRLDDLMRENAQLRRRLLQKTDQFCEYRANIEKLQTEKIRSTKEKVQIVLRARQKASLSVAMGTHELDMPSQQDRPLSAPITTSETNNAKLKTDIP